MTHRLDALSRGSRLIALVLMILLCSACGSSDSAASEVDTDLRAGVYTDLSAFAIGGGLLSPMGSRWFFNPNVELAVADGGRLFTINGDFHYDLPSEGPMSFYLGGGPALLFSDPEGRGGSDTDFGLNLLAGVSGLGTPRPFAQLRGIFANGNEVALMGGIRF